MALWQKSRHGFQHYIKSCIVYTVIDLDLQQRVARLQHRDGRVGMQRKIAN
jgi:hypothetical protein